MVTPRGGSRIYAAPEHMRAMQQQYFRGACDGPAADMWSAGIVLYEMLTGSLPFDLSGVRGLPWHLQLRQLLGIGEWVRKPHLTSSAVWVSNASCLQPSSLLVCIFVGLC